MDRLDKYNSENNNNNNTFIQRKGTHKLKTKNEKIKKDDDGCC